MKKVVRIILCLSLILLITGCNSKKEVKKEKPKGKCKIEECIKLIGLNDNLEKVNEIIGFEGKKKDNTYSWKLTSKQKVEVVFDDANSIKIKILDEEIKNNKTNFTKYSKLEKDLKEGVLIEKTSTTEIYKWVDKEDSYLEATINSTNGKCYRINGLI